jgi:hypothetical protein
LSYCANLKMEAERSSESSVKFSQTVLRYIVKYGTLHGHRCVILKSNIYRKNVNVPKGKNLGLYLPANILKHSTISREAGTRSDTQNIVIVYAVC